MNNSIIIALAAVVLVFLLLLLKKSSARKTPSEGPSEEGEAASPQEERGADDELLSEVELPEQDAGDEGGLARDDEAEELEDAEEDDTPDEAETKPAQEEKEQGESDAEEEAEEPEEPEEEISVPEEAEAEAEPEHDDATDVETEISEELEFDDDEAAEDEPEEELAELPADDVVEVAAEEGIEKPEISLPVETFEQRLFTRKEEHLAALAEAIESNDENTRERLQVELVAITEGLSFLDQSHARETACRANASEALELLKDELDASDYDEARESIRSGETVRAEEVFDSVVKQGSSRAALAAYQSGCLAECRIDFTKAMDSLEKAVELEGDNPDFLRSAALLARKLYKHTKALNWFTSLEKVLENKGGDALELALARRELAYTSALVGRHKEAGALYKKSMVSLTKLRGSDDPELAVCWLQIGKLQEALGQYEKAEDPYKKALAILDKTEGNNVTGEVLAKMAGLYMELEREQEAIPLFERLCAFKEESPNPDKATLAMAYGDLAEAYRVTGKYPESEEKYLRALAITEELRGKDHAAVGSLLQELAQLCDRQGKREEAEAHRERAAAIFQKVMDEQEAAGQESDDLKL